MIQLQRDAAYIRTKSNERTDQRSAVQLTDFDQQVCTVFTSAHTVASAANTLSQSTRESRDLLENRVAESMSRLLEAELIQLSPDS